MAYEMIRTTVGPIFKYQDKYFTIGDTNDMFDLVEEHPDLLSDVTTHLINEVREAVNEYLEALKDGLAFNPQKVYAYINVLNQFSTFKFVQWPQYQKAFTDASNAS